MSTERKVEELVQRARKIQEKRQAKVYLAAFAPIRRDYNPVVIPREDDEETDLVLRDLRAALEAERQRADEAEKIAEATAESAEAWLHKYRDLERTVVRAAGEAGRKQGEAEARADATERSLSEAREALAVAESVIRDTLWMARRYAHGRQTYAPGLVEEAIKRAASIGIELEPDRALASGTQEEEVGDGE